jgi:hypothetical protein
LLISSYGFLRLPNNLFSTQIIKQPINCVFSSIIHSCLPTFGQVFYPTLEEIGRFGREEFVEPILELSVVVEGNYTQIVGESGRGDNPMGKVPESREDVEEWSLSSYVSGVVMLKNHSMSSTRAGVFAGLLLPDSEVVDNSVQQ